MAKLITLMKVKHLSSFVSKWRPLLHFLFEKDKNEVLILESDNYISLYCVYIYICIYVNTVYCIRFV